jgi:hypothetical protein
MGFGLGLVRVIAPAGWFQGTTLMMAALPESSNGGWGRGGGGDGLFEQSWGCGPDSLKGWWVRLQMAYCTFAIPCLAAERRHTLLAPLVTIWYLKACRH